MEFLLCRSRMKKIMVLIITLTWLGGTCGELDEQLFEVGKLKMFVDDLPDMPRLHGFSSVHGILKPTSLQIGMFSTKWVLFFSSFNLFFSEDSS